MDATEKMLKLTKDIANRNGFTSTDDLRLIMCAVWNQILFNIYYQDYFIIDMNFKNTIDQVRDKYPLLDADTATKVFNCIIEEYCKNDNISYR